LRVQRSGTSTGLAAVQRPAGRRRLGPAPAAPRHPGHPGRDQRGADHPGHVCPAHRVV